MMSEFITPDDLKLFRIELLNEIKKLFAEHSGAPIQKQWLKTYEVRKILNLSSSNLHNLRINGTLRYTRIGHLIFYNYQDILKLLNDNVIDHSKNIPHRKKNILQ